MKFYAKFGAEDVLRRIFVLDTLILNTDRHLGNFGFLFDNQTMEVKRNVRRRQMFDFAQPAPAVGDRSTNARQ